MALSFSISLQDDSFWSEFKIVAFFFSFFFGESNKLLEELLALHGFAIKWHYVCKMLLVGADVACCHVRMHVIVCCIMLQSHKNPFSNLVKHLFGFFVSGSSTKGRCCNTKFAVQRNMKGIIVELTWGKLQSARKIYNQQKTCKQAAAYLF